MRERVLNRIAGILMISVILLWNVAPIISYAGTFMTPGQPMIPGKFYNPGQPITGGTFIVPGEVYEPGKSAETGKLDSTSGKLILQDPTKSNSIFEIPNVTPPPAPSLFWKKKLLGGEGHLPDGGSLTNNFQKPDDGQGSIGGPGSNSNPKVNHEQSSKDDQKYETANSIHDFGKNAKKYLVTYPKRLGEMLDGILSIRAGFRIKDLHTASGNKNLYQILGRTTVTNANNPVSMWLNLRYQNYLVSFNDKKLILRNNILRNGTEVKAKKITPFFQSNVGFKSALKKIGKDFSDNWNPFSNPFNPANKGIGKFVNKEFFKFSKVAKGSGLGNVLLSTGGRIIDYATDSKKSFKSTDFAAGISTDVAFGVGSTAISAGAGWAATTITASAIGSVVPGVGTAVGALVGIGVGLFLETKTGRRLKAAVEKGVKKIYDGALSLGKKLGSGLKSIFG